MSFRLEGMLRLLDTAKLLSPALRESETMNSLFEQIRCSVPAG